MQHRHVPDNHIATTVRDFLPLRGVQRYSLYMQDYGTPVGFRLIADELSAVTAMMMQNDVIHLEGFPVAQDPHGQLRRYWAQRDPAADQAQIKYARKLTAPGVAESRNDLWFDYGSNLARYPSWQATLRKMDIPVLVLWGNQDKFFTTPGAKAYLHEAPWAEIHILDAGHFATLQRPDEIAQLISTFVDRHRSTFATSDQLAHSGDKSRP